MVAAGSAVAAVPLFRVVAAVSVVAIAVAVVTVADIVVDHPAVTGAGHPAVTGAEHRAVPIVAGHVARPGAVTGVEIAVTGAEAAVPDGLRLGPSGGPLPGAHHPGAIHAGLTAVVIVVRAAM